MAISNSVDRFNGVVASLAIKVRCVVGMETDLAFTVSGAPSGISNPYDGVFIVDGDRVLLTAQTNPIENGIWVADAANLWARAADWDGNRDIEKGSTVWAGVASASDRLWQVTNPAGVIQPGTTAVTVTLLLDPDLVGQNNPIVLAELANSGPDVLGFGQIWVRDDDPNVLMFTDDLGNDIELGAGGDLETVTTLGKTTSQGIDVTLGAQLRVFNAVADANLTIDVDNVGGPVNIVGNNGNIIMTSAGNLEFNVDIAGNYDFGVGGNNALTIQNNITRVNTDSGGFFQIRDDIGSNLNIVMGTDGPNLIAAASVGGDPDRYLFQPAAGGEGLVFQMAQRAAARADIAGYGQLWVLEGGAAGDPFLSEVQIQAPFEGSDAATAYTEISPNLAIATFFGNAQLDTAQFNSGVSSLLLDGTGDYVTFPDIAAYNIGTQSWTIEGFVRFNTLPPLQASTGPGFVLYDSRRAGSALIQYGIIQDAFGFRVRLVGQDWGAEVGTISGGISTGVWYHWAVTRDVGGDNNVRAYFNGLYEVADFGVSPADLGNPDAPIYIGSRTGIDAYHDGWIDDVRVTIGTARYTGTGAYSVPTTPFPNDPPSANTLYYTDDFGVDYQLNGAGSIVPPIVLGDDEQIQFGDDTDAEMHFDSISQNMRIVLAPGIDFDVRGGSSGTESLLTANSDGGFISYWNGNQVTLTADPTVTGNISGMVVKDATQQLRWVGFNDLRKMNDNVDDTLEAGHAGRIAFKDAATARTLTLAADVDLDFAVDAMTTVLNAFTSGLYTVLEGASTTLYYLDGATRIDTAGGITIDPGGVVNVWRESATVYYCWGTGITP